MAETVYTYIRKDDGAEFTYAGLEAEYLAQFSTPSEFMDFVDQNFIEKVKVVVRARATRSVNY